MKLTQQCVNRLTCPAGKSEVFYWDDEIRGFGFRIRANGTRTWTFQYEFAGDTKRLKLGDHPALPAAEARSMALQHKLRVQNGFNPALEKEQRIALSTETFKACVEPFLLFKQDHVRPTSLSRLKLALSQATLLHSRPMTAIDRRAVAMQVEQVKAARGPGSAKSMRDTLNNFFVWAISTGLIDVNPVIGTPSIATDPRERVLDDNELKAVWTHLGSGHFDDIVRLLILTSQRRTEIGGLCWSEVDLKRAVITLPGDRTKNHKQHLVPLSEPAIDIISRQQHRVERDGIERDQIFGNRQKTNNVHGKHGYRGWGVPFDKLRARIAADGIVMEHWTLHDLRRSTSTGLGNLGVAPHVISAILNHTMDGPRVTRTTYNHATYEPQKRQALALWGQHVIDLVEGREAKIVALAAAREAD